MTDFTSALYLGLEHPSRDLPAWPKLTLGKPAALESIEGAQPVETELAALAGCERAVLTPSTLHAFLDVFSVLEKEERTFFLDEDAYPLAGYMLRRSEARIHLFGARCGNPLEKLIDRRGRGKPVIVTDGYFPLLGKASPLRHYAKVASETNGLLVVDDSQAFGLLGRCPGQGAPYGSGGGGSLPQNGIDPAHVILIASLAKAFGVPVAVVAGTRERLASLEEWSVTRVHCSPVSAAAVAAAANALRVNRLCGELLRSHLAHLVLRLRSGLQTLELPLMNGLFPIQEIVLNEGRDPLELVHTLGREGIQCVLTRAAGSVRGQVCLSVTAKHTVSDIDMMLTVLGRVNRSSCSRRYRKENNGATYIASPL